MSALTVCIIRVWSRIMQWLIVMAAIIILSPARSFAQLNGQNIGFATLRYQWELVGRTTTEGAAWNLSFVFPLKPIQIP